MQSEKSAILIRALKKNVFSLNQLSLPNERHKSTKYCRDIKFIFVYKLTKYYDWSVNYRRRRACQKSHELNFAKQTFIASYLIEIADICIFI